MTGYIFTVNLPSPNPPIQPPVFPRRARGEFLEDFGEVALVAEAAVEADLDEAFFGEAQHFLRLFHAHFRQ